MAVDLTLFPFLEEASGTDAETKDVALAMTGLLVDDGFDAEEFYNALEALPSEEAPARLCCPMTSGDELPHARTDRYGKRLRTTTIGAILSLEKHRGARATARNWAVLGYLRAYAERGPRGLDSRVLLFWH